MLSIARPLTADVLIAKGRMRENADQELLQNIAGHQISNDFTPELASRVLVGSRPKVETVAVCCNEHGRDLPSMRHRIGEVESKTWPSFWIEECFKCCGKIAVGLTCTASGFDQFYNMFLHLSLIGVKGSGIAD